VEECVAAGIELVVLVNGRYKGALEDHFDVSYEVEDVLRLQQKTELLDRIAPLSTMIDIVSVRQNRPLGLGHAVLCARHVVGEDEPFAVLLPDDIVDAPLSGTEQLSRVHAETGCGAIALVEVPSGHESMYGIIEGESVGPGRYRCTHMVEKPAPADAPSNLGIVGRYVLPGTMFRYLAETRPGKGGEIQLTDGLVRLMKDDGVFGQVLEGDRYDTGSAAGLIEANLAYAMKRPALAERLRGFMRQYTK
ncbi:MAG: UTP--glucose-1-phosphate uridylyltransferase, partial [Rhodothermaceae bacterium]|nr:UTP--glucose-1-phosphate uridylyltransferase [Rhodothermaceae bacterium]